ncbi:CLUMA_CG017330, isoform A [Clunio marinus]|uniref:CLUMA_CG017330, isoform A n=1 Tax=Clunio marinus TaxID=568069 RepID=A0A1J1J050_9DIPT|nr:CLUMA_CG017330, isoform A [Clunio marinus]
MMKAMINKGAERVIVSEMRINDGRSKKRMMKLNSSQILHDICQRRLLDFVKQRKFLTMFRQIFNNNNKSS